MIGQTISHYRIIEKLGLGGMGEVYLAEDTRLGRRVALKFLAPELARDHESLVRFRNEAKAAAELSHPNIATIHDIGDADGKPFLVLEYLQGQTLRGRIAQGPLPVEDVVRIGQALAAGLAEAHSHGIVHRDIKSANVMLTDKGEVKILDFGLAHRGDATQLTRPGTTLGTIHYMSPEQTRGEQTDERSDLWSVGIVLYECLTGQLPFTGDGAAIIEQIKTAAPPPPTALRTGIPMELERVVLRCLQNDSNLRCQHAADLLAELKLVEMTSGPGASQAAEFASPRRPGVSSRPEHSATHATAAGRGRGRSVGLGTVVVIFTAVVFFLSRGEKEPPHDVALTVAAPIEKSIAVLPFTNLSDDSENEYFSDGITEDILAQLSKIGDLIVISRTSIMRYKNTDKSLQQIGKELGVGTILEGSVRRSGDRVRIVGQLIDARSDKHIWAETYDRDLTDIFEVQSDVAKQIAVALAAELSPVERERIERSPTADLVAYDYYLKGREYFLRYTKEDNERALELYGKALSLDSDYALAYAGISSVYAQRYFRFGFEKSWVDSAIAVAENALAIDPDLAEGHLAIGNAYFGKGWHRRAIEPYKRAIEINPNYAVAVANIGGAYAELGEIVEQFRWYKRSMALDPTKAHTRILIGQGYGLIGDYVQAEKWLYRALQISPDASAAEFMLGYMKLLQGKKRQAFDHIEQTLSKYPDNVAGLAYAGRISLYSGLDAQARKYLEKLIELAPEGHDGRTASIWLSHLLWKAGEEKDAKRRLSDILVDLEDEMANGHDDMRIRREVASVYALQGDSEKACEWLQKAVDAGSANVNVRDLELDPVFASLRENAQFQEIIAKVDTKRAEIREEIEAME